MIHSSTELSAALKIGRKGIFKEIADAENAARKRSSVKYGSFDASGTGCSDLNFFRTILADCWVRYAFWLMRDEVVASVITTVGMKPRDLIGKPLIEPSRS